MMTSLFESFDLMNNSSFSLNWLVILAPLMILYNFWLVPSRSLIIWNIIVKTMYKEFKSTSANFESNILIFISMMLFIFILNFAGLFPYIFTITSHAMASLSISLSLWGGFTLFLLVNNLKKLLCHLVPLNTPGFLMNFMVLIELVSNLIRPLTLSIRLSANIMAGHLLMILLGNFMSSVNIFLVFVAILVQNILLILELSMSFIQAYVFSMLSILYFVESK